MFKLVSMTIISFVLQNIRVYRTFYQSVMDICGNFYWGDGEKGKGTSKV